MHALLSCAEYKSTSPVSCPDFSYCRMAAAAYPARWVQLGVPGAAAAHRRVVGPKPGTCLGRHGVIRQQQPPGAPQPVAAAEAAQQHAGLAVPAGVCGYAIRFIYKGSVLCFVAVTTRDLLYTQMTTINRCVWRLPSDIATAKAGRGPFRLVRCTVPIQLLVSALQAEPIPSAVHTALSTQKCSQPLLPRAYLPAAHSVPFLPPAPRISRPTPAPAP